VEKISASIVTECGIVLVPFRRIKADMNKRTSRSKSTQSAAVPLQMGPRMAKRNPERPLQKHREVVPAVFGFAPEIRARADLEIYLSLISAGDPSGDALSSRETRVSAASGVRVS